MAQNHLVVDLHLHSRFSMGTSPSLDIRTLAAGARQKGIDVLAAPDYTHPDWFAEIKSELEEVAPGTYRAHGVEFVLVTEVSCVFEKYRKGRRVHVLIAAPGFAAAEAMAARLARLQDLRSDGRPTLGISVRDLAEIVWDVDERFELIPAHIWTPWYGMLGSRSGFDSIDECLGDLADRILAIETGLSSDPAMNWNVPAIGSRSIVSFSDAHSPGTMGRELTILDAPPTYRDIMLAIREAKIVETVELYPEHGKYHFDGHRKCRVRLSPEESEQLEGKCPSCGRTMTLGVLNRVARLSGSVESPAMGGDGLVKSSAGHPPFRRLVPLRDVLGAALGVGPTSKRVGQHQQRLHDEFGGELNILTVVSTDAIAAVAGEDVAAAIDAVRQNNFHNNPGFDGQYGTVRPLMKTAG